MTPEFEALKERIKSLPTEPGCYIMKDHKGKIFYIGKAINLRNRVRSYFTGQDTRTFVKFLGKILADIDIIMVRNGTEALLLEQTLIQKHKPKFNILLRDDKSYILLKLNYPSKKPDAPKHDQYPRLEIVRKTNKDKAKYFGPYPSASQLRMTLHLINKNFQLRTCNDQVIDRRNRPCIQHQIGRCLAPCVYEVPQYQDELNTVTMFLNGQTSEIIERLTHKMWLSSEQENYEQAAKIRDQIEAIQKSLEEQTVNIAGSTRNQDVIAAVRTGPFLEIVHLVVRKGRTLGSQHYSFENQEFPTEELVSSFLLQRYKSAAPSDIPEEILLSTKIDDTAILSDALSEQKGSKVTLLYPQRGKLKKLVDIAVKNAHEALQTHLAQKETHLKALDALQCKLGLKKPPRVIECFDVSLFQGTDAVASQVCFSDGMPDKNRYRKYHIKTVQGTDDFAMLYEVITRRLKRALQDEDFPDLMLVDGGKGQLGVALAACKDLGIEVNKDKFYVAGIAKSRIKEPTGASEDVEHTFERLFIPGVKDPLNLLPHTAERYLVERIRDEAHRFAITFHRNKRAKRTLRSQISQIPGVGEKRGQMLLKHFGSIQNLVQASLDDLMKVKGVSKDLAERIHEHLKS